MQILKEGQIKIGNEIKEIPIPTSMENPYWDSEKKCWYEKQDEELLKIYDRKMLDLIDVIGRFERLGKKTEVFKRDLEDLKEEYKKTKLFLEKNS